MHFLFILLVLHKVYHDTYTALYLSLITYLGKQYIEKFLTLLKAAYYLIVWMDCNSLNPVTH